MGCNRTVGISRNASLRIIRAACALLIVLGCTACFTGVESTPKITAKEVKKQRVVETAESHYLDGITADLPSEWQKGRRFYIADNRAARAAWRVSPFEFSDSIAGKTALLTSVDTVPSLTGASEVMLSMQIPGATDVSLEFRTGLTREQWNNARTFVIPHVIDMQTVDGVADALVGKRFYILPARRIGNNGTDTVGTRYAEVRILGVSPDSEATPLRVSFADNEGHISSVLMTLGDPVTSRRNFDTLFAIDNPRNRYKHITDENWELIIHGRIAAGMTPEECRLSLGAPDSYSRIPTTAGMVERWSYTNGVYLIFEDGLLSRFRQ